MSSWLITGGCGFIGGNLLATLLRTQEASEIRVLDNVSVGTQEDLEIHLSKIGLFSKKESGSGVQYRLGHSGAQLVELLIGDVRDESATRQAAVGVDVVVHLAANTGVQPSVQDPRLDMESNVLGTFNLLEACRLARVGRFIFASSSAVVGDTQPPIREDKVPRPLSPYGASKLAGEAYCSAYARTYGIRTTALRFSNVYGPWSRKKDSVVAKFIRNAMLGLPLEINGNGGQTRDFIYIDDLVNSIVLSARSDASGEIFQIASSKETTVLELAREISQVIGELTRHNIEVVFRDALASDVRRSYADISKARDILGFDPKMDLATGIRKTIDHYFETRK